MASFGKRSLERLATCDVRLQQVAKAAIIRMDFTVLCGHRNKAEQDDAYERGASKLRFPKSKHNSLPSKAMDLAPYPIDWENIDRFIALSHIVLDEAKKFNIPIRWGGDWNRDGNWKDEKFRDLPHYEIDE